MNLLDILIETSKILAFIFIIIVLVSLIIHATIIPIIEYINKKDKIKEITNIAEGCMKEVLEEQKQKKTKKTTKKQEK